MSNVTLARYISLNNNKNIKIKIFWVLHEQNILKSNKEEWLKIVFD